MVKIISIDNSSPYLVDVKKLWRKNSNTLGFFTDGAFADYAAKRWIIVAIDTDDKCVGYSIYRISRSRCIIVHLCVDSQYRGKNIAKALVESLHKSHKKLNGIGLSCRRDYEISKMWPKLGFVAVTEKVGRSFSGKSLTYWWYEHGNPDLFSFYDENVDKTKVKAVIDANVFFDLLSGEDSDSFESKSLMADWLQDSIILCLTDEIYNEINRNKDLEQRKQLREFADNFNIPKCNYKDIENIVNELRFYYPNHNKRASDESDLRQLAKTIVSEVPFFITRDIILLKESENIYDKFGISIIRPVDLIVRVDELIHEYFYQPRRFAGSLFHFNNVRSQIESELTTIFLSYVKSESKLEFQRSLRKYLSDPTSFQTLLLKDAEQNIVGIIVYGRQNNLVLEIPILRVVKSSLSTTILMHMILQSVLLSANEKRIITNVTDRYIEENAIRILQENCFRNVNNQWIKVNLKDVETADKLVERLKYLSNVFPNERDYLYELLDGLSFASSTMNIDKLMYIEKLLWPLKIADANIPSFIVPIQAIWALDLFDEKLASQTLFGSKPELSMNRENVYYRSKHPPVLSSPGRILWYVSNDKKYLGSKHIRACSQIDGITVGKATDLYKRFRRLGVYEWNHVLNKAKGDPSNEIMAVSFSNTELFANPISWNKLQQVLVEEEGKKSQIQSPVHISSKIFARIYSLGQ